MFDDLRWLRHRLWGFCSWFLDRSEVAVRDQKHVTRQGTYQKDFMRGRIENEGGKLATSKKNPSSTNIQCNVPLLFALSPRANITAFPSNRSCRSQGSADPCDSSSGAKAHVPRRISRW